MSRKSLILLFVISVVGALFIQWSDSPGLIPGDRVSLSKAEYYQLVGTQQRYQKLMDLEHEIREKYYIDPAEIDFDTAIYKGLFSSLDRYSTYYTPQEYDDYTSGLSGEFVGIGATVEAFEDVVRVVEPFRNGPAERAGLLPEDIIWQVDETPLSGLSLDESVELIRGQAGTAVVLHVRRGSENLERRVSRAKVTNPSVVWEKRNDIGYIRISHFESPTAQQFREALKALRQDNIRGLVLDLRSNPGGYLHVVVDIAEQILGRTTIVTEVSRTEEEKVYASRGGSALDIPSVVLVDHSSASASEILAAAVQDTDSAQIIGDTTTGKGVVQTSYRLQDGSGFKITTARYLTPSGRDLHGVGVVPDIDLAAITQAGYDQPEVLRFGAEDDGVLHFAIDFLEAALALR